MPTSLWIREAPALDAGGECPARTDVAVVGGGVAGICAALHLARAGADVCVLEAGEVASRASGRNDGQVLLGLGEHYNRIVGQFGDEDARALWAFIRDNNGGLRSEVHDAGIDCGLTEAGGLRLAETEHEFAELQQAGALLATEGIDHRLVDAAGVRELLPAAEGFHGAMLLPGESCVQPAAMVRGLAALARSAGARIVQHAPVAAIEGAMGQFDVRLADGRRLEATAVVHCTAALGAAIDRSGFLGRTVFPFRGQIIATDPLPDAVQERFAPYAMSSNFCYEYFRMHGGRFVLGGMRWSVKGEELRITDDGAHNPEVSRNLEAYARRHFPILADTPFPEVWTGIMAGTHDGLPLVGPMPGQPGAFAYLAFNGYGLSFAWLGGKLLADHVLKGKSDHPAAAMFDPRRLR